MAMNSVNTNISSMVALQSLNRTSDQLSVVQKCISTGFRVADAKDDGGAFAVTQAVRAKESAKLQSLQIRQQLGTQAMSIANQAPQTLLSLFR